MAIVSAHDVDKAFEVFCKGMRLDIETWNAIFEFTALLGFGLLNVTKKSVRHGDDLGLTDRSAQTIAQLLGPHSETLMRIYKIRRFSFQGRLRTVVTKTAHRVCFGICVVVAILIEMREAV